MHEITSKKLAWILYNKHNWNYRVIGKYFGKSHETIRQWIKEIDQIQ